MTTAADQSPFGVPWRSAILFVIVVGIFLALMLLTFDQGVGTLTWVLRWAGAAAWVAFAGYLGYRDIISKKAGTTEDIDHIPFDRWTWVHATAGALFGLWSVPLLLVAIITVAWEFFEAYVPGFGEKEILLNRVVDVAVAWIGWLLLALAIGLLEGSELPVLSPAPESWLRDLGLHLF